jgi:hypothetical protein
LNRILKPHRLRPYRSSNRTARRDPRSGCMPVPRPPNSLGRGDNWTTPDRRLSPYRSRASPTRKLPAFTDFARPTARARKRLTIPTARLYCTSATNNPLKKLMILNTPPLPSAPSASQLSRTMRNHNQRPTSSVRVSCIPADDCIQPPAGGPFMIGPNSFQCSPVNRIICICLMGA